MEISSGSHGHDPPCPDPSGSQIPSGTRQGLTFSQRATEGVGSGCCPGSGRFLSGPTGSYRVPPLWEWGSHTPRTPSAHPREELRPGLAHLGSSVAPGRAALGPARTGIGKMTSRLGKHRSALRHRRAPGRGGGPAGSPPALGVTHSEGTRSSEGRPGCVGTGVDRVRVLGCSGCGTPGMGR